jgi:hypothetical protein
METYHSVEFGLSTAATLAGGVGVCQCYKQIHESLEGELGEREY